MHISMVVLIGINIAHQEGKKNFQQIDKNRINLDIFVAFFRTVTEMQFHFRSTIKAAEIPFVSV
jgi:hypothetical protein